jgi:hypothetical protein
MTIAARRAGPGVPADPKYHARQIAHAVSETWFQQYNGAGLEVPLSVTAVLALTGMYTASGPGLAEVLPPLDRGRFMQLIQRCALEWSINRPDLVPAVKPVFGRLTGVDGVAGIDEHTVRAMHTVGAAAIRAGVLEYGRDPECRRAADLLGTLLQVRAPARARPVLHAGGRDEAAGRPDVPLATLMRRILTTGSPPTTTAERGTSG